MLAVTAFAMDADRDRALDSGFDGYLQKPISMRDLVHQVGDVLEHGRTAMTGAGKVRVLAVDDHPANLRLLDALLTPRGYDVLTAASGEEALERLGATDVDIVLLDIVLPGIDGYEVCRRIREDEATAYLPVVMVTASGEEQKVRSLEAGADDFLTKPVRSSELLARVASLARLKRYHDTVERQTAELAAWNRELEARVARQVADLERMSELGRFLPPQLVELLVDSGDRSFLESHRREIIVVFCDLRGFTPFAEVSEPEEVMGVLADYHRAVGRLIFAFGGTLERFTGDGLMVFFNDPVPCDDGASKAVRMSMAIQTEVRALAASWAIQGHDLALGIGIAQGFATLGRIGFEGRFDYAAIGSVTNLAARLCAEAGPWEVLAAGCVVAAAGTGWPARSGTGASRGSAARSDREPARPRRRGREGARAMTTTPAVLSQLSEEERYRRFDDLQERMVTPGSDALRPRGRDRGRRPVPSRRRPRVGEPRHLSGTAAQAMEERFLFLLVLLRQPRLRMVYVTSLPIAPEIVEYYLALLPGVIPSHARSRLTLVSLNDASPRPLSEKLLARPRQLRRIAAVVPNRARAHLIPYNTTTRERDVALSLGIPMYGADPRLAPWGTKTGCRRLFAEVGVPHPLGAEDLHGEDDLVEALAGMRAQRPSISSVILKLNDGVSGKGNAVVSLAGLPEPGHPGEPAALRDRLRHLEPEAPTVSVDGYLEAFTAGGGIVEERIVGEDLRSPSVQLRVVPGGELELLSTHDQMLGGASGQSYLGCIFPASEEYAALIAECARPVGTRLAELGVLGRFAVDFVVVRSGDGTWTPYAIELNLRKGGTTHPFLTLQFLTDGRYDADRAVFLTPTGGTASTSSPPTTSSRTCCAASCRRTSSTSWPGAGCTSTSPDRRGSSSTW